MMVETVLSRTVRLLYASGLVLGSMHAAYAQTSAPENIQRVEVTGSSIRRTNIETALPVTVVSRADIERSGVQSTEELLGQLNSVSSAGGQVNAGQSALPTYGKSAVSLRGIGSDKTLVLVNGRRLANFAGGGADVNINAIPLAAVDRVEVLQDGASGVYGSDAIAGVVNFILRKEFEGLEINATHGAPTRGGGAKSNKLSVVGGYGDYDKDRYAVVFSAAREKEGNLLGSERDYAKTDTNVPYYAGGSTETGRIEGTWDFPGGANLADAGKNLRSAANPYGISNTGYGNPFAAMGKCAEIGMAPRPSKGYSAGEPAVGAPAAAQNSPNCIFDTGKFVSLVPNREFTGASGNLRFKASDNHELYADGLYSKNVFVNPVQPVPVRQGFLINKPQFTGSGVDPALLIYPSNPNYKIAADYLNSVGLGAMVGHPLAVTERAFLLGPRTTKDTAEQSRVVLGAKGTIGNLDYDMAYVRNASKTDGSVIDGFASILGLARVLNNPAVQWNPWAPLGQQSADVSKLLEAAKYNGPTIESTSKNEGVDAMLQGTLMELPGGAIRLAGGLQARDESYVVIPAPATLSGDVAGLNAIQPVNAKRTVWAVFGETIIPFSKTIEANLAVRQDSYSDFGKTFNYKASARYQPMPEIVVRSSVGTGFHAPSLPGLYTPTQLGFTEAFTDPHFPNANKFQVTSVGGGNPNLGPEKSDQRSVGVVWAPFKSFAASIDYFNMEIKGLIATPAAQEIVAGFRRGTPGYAALVEVNAANEITLIRQQSRNQNSLKTEGVDLDLRYRENMLGGRVMANLNGTYTRKYDLVNSVGETEGSVGTIVRPDGAPLAASPSGVILRWKHTASAGYSASAFNVTLSQRYYAGYRTGNDLNKTPHYIKGQALYDLVGSYTGTKNLKLSIGLRNLFDKAPPLFISNGTQAQSGYDAYQYDPRGRFAYVQASYNFF